MGFLADLAVFFASIPFQWKLVGLCITIASWFTSHKDKFLLNYWVSWTFCSALLLAMLLLLLYTSASMAIDFSGGKFDARSRPSIRESLLDLPRRRDAWGHLGAEHCQL